MTRIAHHPDPAAKRLQAYRKHGLTAEDVLDAILSDLDTAVLGPNGRAAVEARRKLMAEIPKPPATPKGA